MKYEILIYNKTREKIPKEFIKSIISRALNFLKIKRPAELAVLVVSPLEIKRLNKLWRHKSYTPDELSFGLNSRKSAHLVRRQNKVLELGEIVVNSEKIFDKKYLTTLLIHSLLHLLGYDHEKSIAKAKKMEKLEKQILKYLNTKY